MQWEKGEPAIERDQLAAFARRDSEQSIIGNADESLFTSKRDIVARLSEHRPTAAGTGSLGSVGYSAWKRAPGYKPGALVMRQGPVYRLTWRLVPPPGAPRPASPVETSLTQSESGPL
jgi:hypothetical protein